MAGMALGYGLGRFPHPHFHFHSPQEEHFYNYYMYRKYGIKSTDGNDYSRDYQYSQPPETFDRFMDSCMKRTDLLPDEKRLSDRKLLVTTTRTTTTASVKTTTTPPATGITSSTPANTTTANNSTVPPSTPQPLNKSEANPTPPTASQVLQDDDDTVSIVEIGYPALIRQMKTKRCTELYIVYSEKYLKKKEVPTTSGVEDQNRGSRGLLSLLTVAIVLLLNSDMSMLLH